jgi:hydroxymethylbilane synthase
VAAFRIATRKSALALWQARRIQELLGGCELVPMTTEGDRILDRSLAEVGGKGLFVKELERALADGRADLAVHSAKDVPFALPDEFELSAFTEREDPRDALIARDGLTLGELPPGSTIGTGAPRRVAQLAALGLGLTMVPIRGNVDTRLRKVADGELDAVVLARAGLARLGRLAEITEVLDPIQMLPAPAQGALAIECRVNDMDTEHLLGATIDDEPTRAAVAAERSMLAALEAGCSAPVGALADVVEDLVTDADGADRVVLRLSLRGMAATPDNEILRASAISDLTNADELGRLVAAELLDLGASVLSGPEA